MASSSPVLHAGDDVGADVVELPMARGGMDPGSSATPLTAMWNDSTLRRRFSAIAAYRNRITRSTIFSGSSNLTRANAVS